MPCIFPKEFMTKSDEYDYIFENLLDLIETEDNWLPNAANAASLLGLLLKDLNWAGFYLKSKEELVLGPFWGKPAVTRIDIGNGVCGLAAKSLKTIVVHDVHEFPGHITCDLMSNSEIVLPIIVEDKLIGVLDIDSPIIGRFDDEDKNNLEKLVEILTKHIKWPSFY